MSTPPDAKPEPTPRSRIIAQKLIPNIGVVWVAATVFDRSLTWDEAIAVLRTINIESALLTMAMLNAVSYDFAIMGKSEKVTSGPKVNALANYLLAPARRKLAMQIYAKDAANFAPLAPQACIAMTESCARFCNRDGGRRFNQPHECDEFAWVLLSFQAHLIPEELAAELNFEALTESQFRTFTRNYLAANYEVELAPLPARHFMMFANPDRSGVLGQKVELSPAEWFERVTGISALNYGLLQVIFVGLGFNFSIEAPNLTHLVYDLDEMLANVRPEIATEFRKIHDLALLSFDELDKMALPGTWDAAVYHQHYLRRKPIWKLTGGKYICLHKHLIIEKFFASTIHVLTELVETHPPAGWSSEIKERRLKVRREMGYIFEDYLRSLLRIVFAGSTTEFFFGFANQEAEQDALILIGRTALVLEFVHHPWSLKERNSGAQADFIGHLIDNATKAQRTALALERGLAIDGRPIAADRILPIIVMSEMLPINEATAPTLASALISATSTDTVNGRGKILPLQILSTAQLLNLDRLTQASAGPSMIVEFLAQRAVGDLVRFSGHRDLDQHLGRPVRLAAITEQAQAVFEANGPSMFLG